MNDIAGMLCYGVVIVFAVIGLWVVLFKAWSIVSMTWDTLKKLNATLQEGIEVLKLYKADFAAMRKLYESSSQETVSQSITQDDAYVPQCRTEERVTFPPPVWAAFKTEPKAPEPDAEEESVSAYDVTPSDSEITDEDKADKLEQMGFGRPDPEFVPKAVEANSE